MIGFKQTNEKREVRMKHSILVVALMLMAFVLVSCDNSSNTSNNTDNNTTQNNDTDSQANTNDDQTSTDTTQTNTDDDQTSSNNDSGNGTENNTDTSNVAVNRDGEIPAEPLVVGDEAGLTTAGMPGGKLVHVTFTGPKSFNNVVTQETSSSFITRMWNRGLVEVNPKDFSIVPALAKSWEQSDDKTEWIFHLREGLKFSDGHPLTAEDVVFTFNDVLFNDDVHAAAEDNLLVNGEPFEVEAIDDLTVKITTVAPFRPLLRGLALYGASILPKHMVADKLFKLNPGVSGVLGLVQETLDNNMEAFNTASEEATTLLGQALGKLQEVIDAKNGQLLVAAQMGVQLGLGSVMEALDTGMDDFDGLKAAIDAASEEVDKLTQYAGEDKWAGVPPGTFNNTWGLDSNATDLIGAGPYRFVRYDTDQQVVMERNPYYWKVDANGTQLPYMEQLVFLFVENQDVRFLKFKSGEADLLDGRSDDWPLLLEKVNTDSDCQQLGDKIHCQDHENNWDMVRGGPRWATTYTVFNLDAPDPVLRAVFRNNTFRKAVAYAYDKQSMIDNIYSGLALAQWSPVAIPSPYFDSNSTFETYPFDIEQAEQMMDEIGITDTDDDGVRNITDRFLQDNGIDVSTLTGEQSDEDTRELSFAFNTNAGNQQRERMSSLIASDLNRVGINANYKPKDFNALVTDLLGSKYEMILIGFTGDVDPSTSSNIWTTPGSLHMWKYSSKDTPEDWEVRVDELYRLASAEFDEDLVEEYFREFQQLVSENLPLIYTVNEQFVYASSTKLMNNESFQAINAALPAGIAFSEIVWWDDEVRRNEVVAAAP